MLSSRVSNLGCVHTKCANVRSVSSALADGVALGSCAEESAIRGAGGEAEAPSRVGEIVQVVLDYRRMAGAGAEQECDLGDQKLPIKGERVRATGVAVPRVSSGAATFAVAWATVAAVAGPGAGF